MSLPSRRPVHLIRLVLLLLCCFFLLPVTFSAKAFAASDPITVTSQRVVVHFPGSIDFSMAAKDIARPIVQATLYITLKEPPYTFSKEHAVNISRPAQAITTLWHE